MPDALRSPRALERPLLAFVLVRTDERTGEQGAGAGLAAVPEVLEVHHVAGQDSYLVKVRAKDTEHLQGILQQFGAIPGVRDTRTTVVLTTLKESRTLPLPGAQDAAGSNTTAITVTEE